jgi:tetratricopeptide (TPR) repeat protein
MSSSRFLPPMLAVLVLLCGCAGSEVDRAASFRREKALTAEQDLARLARLESQAGPPTAAPASIPPPAGVEGAALARRDAADPRPTMSLDDALQQLAGRSELPAGAEGSTAPQPPDPDALDQAVRHYVKGRQAALEGDHLTAAFELDKARQLDPTSTAILRELAHSFAAQRNTPRAAALFEEILRLDADDSEALFTLAMAAANRRDFERAAILLSGRRAAGRRFTHDAAADLIVDFTLHLALQQLGYDRASIEAALPIVTGPLPLDLPTFHRARILALQGQQGEIWRAIGDAHCRLGEYEEALEAYGRAESFAGLDTPTLRRRIIYADLQSGRVFAAQHELLSALASGGPSVSDDDVRLCSYLVEHATDSEVFVEAVLDLQRARPDDPGLAQAAAMLLPPGEARALLGQFVDRRPRDIQVVGQLLTWLGEREPAAAVDLAASLISAHLDLARPYTDALMRALPDPYRAIDVASDPSTPGQVQVRVRVLMRLWAQGEAWECCRRALERWPDDDGLRLLRIELAGALDEPHLLRAALEGAGDLTSRWSWLVRAAALRETEELDGALEAGQRALSLARQSGTQQDQVGPLLELARAHVARAAPMPVNEARDAVFRQAVDLAEQARSLAPAEDEPYELLLGLYGTNGPFSDPQRFQDLVAELRRAGETSRFYARLVIQDDLQNGRNELALSRARKLLEDGRNDYSSLGLAIIAWQQLGRMEEAEQWVSSLLARRPGDPALLEQYARMMLGLDQADDARRFLQHRLDDDGDDPTARRLLELVCRMRGDAEQAATLGERRLGARPEGSRRELELAALYANAGWWARAADRLEWIARHVEVASLRHLTGAVAMCSRLEGLGDRRELLTLELVESAIEHFAEVPLQVYGLGLRAIVRLEGTDERFDALTRRAAEEARGADNLTAQGAVAWQTPAQALVEEDRPDAAARVLRARLDCSRDLEAPARALLASMILIADAASADGATRSIDLLVDLEGRGLLTTVPGLGGAATLSEALMQIGNLYTLLGNDAGAETLMRESIRLDAANGMAMNNLGYQWLEEGRDDDQTIAWIERAGELLPDSASVIDTVGWLRYKQRRFDDEAGQPGAVSLLRRAVELSEQPAAELFDHLGDALWRLGRSDEAVDAWRQAVRLLEDPGSRDQLLQLYLAEQTRVWGLLVRDPQAMYDRDYGVVLERTREKLRQAERGGDPPIAATFQELAPAD